MKEYLDAWVLPQYFHSRDRFFLPGERHVTRVCREDVLVLVRSGVLRFEEERRPVAVGPGEYYIQRRGLYQQGVVPSDQPAYYYIHFRGVWQEEQGILRAGRFSEEAWAVTREMAALEEEGGSLLEKTAAFYRLLALLPCAGQEKSPQALAQRIRELLRLGMEEGAALPALAGQLHFSVNYLIRVFKSAYGITPHQYLTQLRLEQAQRLMARADLSLEQIALACGFGDYAGFYRACRQARGITPREMRENAAAR